MSTSPQVDLKNKWLAATLAFLIPGAGHLYQGRLFKAVLYSICILGTFFSGMALGDWQVVYLKWEPGKREIGYLSQVLVGLPALPALIQRQRYKSAETHLSGDDKLRSLTETISSSFRGRMIAINADGSSVVKNIDGQMQLAPAAAGGFEVQGLFTGKSEAGENLTLHLGGSIKIGPDLCASEKILGELAVDDERQPVTYSSRRRYLQCDVVDEQGTRVGTLEGTVPRSVLNWFEVPPEEDALQNLHGRLGRFFELAKVFTWIAGLLNLLAIWDALEGPAYGYGNESETSQEFADQADKAGNGADASASGQRQDSVPEARNDAKTAEQAVAISGRASQSGSS